MLFLQLMEDYLVLLFLLNAPFLISKPPQGFSLAFYLLPKHYFRLLKLVLWLLVIKGMLKTPLLLLFFALCQHCFFLLLMNPSFFQFLLTLQAITVTFILMHVPFLILIYLLLLIYLIRFLNVIFGCIVLLFCHYLGF
jgi:hypothetical protein